MSAVLFLGNVRQLTRLLNTSIMRKSVKQPTKPNVMIMSGKETTY